jgi:hypothetical protein
MDPCLDPASSKNGPDQTSAEASRLDERHLSIVTNVKEKMEMELRKIKLAKRFLK